jgi:hypothetical protein
MWQEKWCETVGKYEPGKKQKNRKERNSSKNKKFSVVDNVF